MTQRILLVCAQTRAALRVQVALLRHGLMVESVRTFRRGLAILQHRPPDAIVLDTAIPDLDGMQLAAIVKAPSPAFRIPVVLMERGAPAVESPLETQLGHFAVARVGWLPETQLITALQRASVT
jgi:CheY-like chemotaxis protein